jgi:minor curlin subunit
MSRASICFFAAAIVSASPACAQTLNQNSPLNIMFGYGGGNQSSYSVNQTGFTNLYYGVQDANSKNQAVVDQNGLFMNYSQSTQVNQAGWNSIYIRQNGPQNHSEIGQMGGTNIAAVAQNSATGAAPPIPVVQTNGPVYQSYQTQDGYLSLFTTDNFSLAFATPPGLTATSSFYRMH